MLASNLDYVYEIMVQALDREELTDGMWDHIEAELHDGGVAERVVNHEMGLTPTATASTFGEGSIQSQTFHSSIASSNSKRKGRRGSPKHRRSSGRRGTVNRVKG